MTSQMEWQPEFSVIVLNWNGKHFLEECLGSLQGQSLRNFEVILVDNGSTDGSVEFVTEHFPEVIVVPLSKNLGFCGGNNEGIEKSSGEWIMLLNNDTEVVPEFLNAMHQAVRTHPDAGMFACKMLFADSKATIDNCGFTVSRAGTAQEIGRFEIDRGQYGPDLEPFGPSGGAGVYSRAMLDRIGLLDEDFFLIYEDFDLAMRARLQGFRCRFVPEAVVFHKYRSSLGKLPDWQVFYSQRNVEFVYLKNMPAPLVLRHGLSHLLYDAGSLLYFMRKGFLRPFVSAKFEVLRQLRRVCRKRRNIQANRTVSSEQFRALLRGKWLSGRVRKFVRFDASLRKRERQDT
jgi:GT2 family glycosyltransferase